MKLTRKERAALIPNDLDLVLADRDSVIMWFACARYDTIRNGNLVSRLKKLRKDIVIRKLTRTRPPGIRRYGYVIYTQPTYEEYKAQGLDVD
jgi:hypothetical protein